MKKITLLIMMMALNVYFTAPAVAESYHDRIDNFFLMLIKGQDVEAVDYIYTGNPWLSKASDAVKNVKNQIVSMKNLVGGLKNYVKLQEITVGGRFVYLNYMAAYERQPIRFEFEFYKPQEQWMVFSFSFDDKLDVQIQENARAQLAQQ